MSSCKCNPPEKNRTYDNFIKLCTERAIFEVFAGRKLQSVYDHSPQFQLFLSLCMKVMLLQKYASTGRTVTHLLTSRKFYNYADAFHSGFL